jgi:hypothetical protein
MPMGDLIEKFKEHIREEDTEYSVLSFYLEQGRKYVRKATGKESEYLVIMCAGLFYEYRISEKKLGEALDAMTPFFVQEVYSDLEDG